MHGFTVTATDDVATPAADHCWFHLHKQNTFKNTGLKRKTILDEGNDLRGEIGGGGPLFLLSASAIQQKKLKNCRIQKNGSTQKSYRTARFCFLTMTTLCDQKAAATMLWAQAAATNKSYKTGDNQQRLLRQAPGWDRPRLL